MAKTSQSRPTKRKDAEIIVKRNFGLGLMFNDSESWLYHGISVFANRRGFRFLSDYFLWLAERSITESDIDPGDHVHLTPHSSFCDEIDFSFDTLTTSNRNSVLSNAGANEQSRLRGSPIKQFTKIISDITESLEKYLRNDSDFRRITIAEIDELIAVLEEKRARLKDL